MKGKFLILLCTAAVLVGGLSMATAGEPATTLGWGTVLPAQAPVAEPEAVAPTAEGVTPTKAASPLLLTKAGKPMGWQDRRQRRKLGLSPVGIRAKLKVLKEAGEFDELRNKKGRITYRVAKENAPWIAAQVFDLAVAENPAAFALYVQAEELAGRDWAAFLEILMAFLEAFLPFFMMFMFVGQPPAWMRRLFGCLWRRRVA